MSRLNFNLRNITEALTHIESILIKKQIPQKASSYQTSSLTPDSSVNMKSFTKTVEFANETSILKDFILYSNTLINESKTKINSLPVIPVPIVESNQIKVNLYPGDSFSLQYGQVLVHNDANLDYSKEPVSQKEKDLLNSLNNRPDSDSKSIDSKQSNELKEMWFKYEQALYTSAYRTALPMLFKPHLTFFDQFTDNRQAPKLVVNETCAVMFEIRNHLRINLVVSDLTLLWKYVTDDLSESITNEMSFKNDETLVDCSTLRELNLTPHETYKLRLHLVPKRANGTLTILGIKYRLGLTSYSLNSTVSSSSITSLTSQLSNTAISENNNTTTTTTTTNNNNNNSAHNNEINEFTTLYGKQLFETKGPRLNNNPVNMRSVVYDVDQRLNFKILNSTPQLQVNFFFYKFWFFKKKLKLYNLNKTL